MSVKRPAARFGLCCTVMALILVCHVSRSHSQPTVSGGISFAVASPQNEFNDNVDNSGFGGLIEGFVHMPGSPVAFGLGLGYLNYGHETRREPFSTTIPDVTVDVETDNAMVMGHFIVRLQQRAGAFAPYVDGLVGFNYIYTDTEIKNEKDDEVIAESTNLDDWAFNYGAGGGLMVYLLSLDGNSAEPGSLYLDFKVRYLAGSEADYLKEGSIIRENGKVIYDMNSSRTDLMLYQIGVAVSF